MLNLNHKQIIVEPVTPLPATQKTRGQGGFFFESWWFFNGSQEREKGDSQVVQIGFS